MAKDYGIKVSKEGVDVKTASPSDLIYSSKWSNFKIKGVYKTNLKGYSWSFIGRSDFKQSLKLCPGCISFL